MSVGRVELSPRSKTMRSSIRAALARVFGRYLTAGMMNAGLVELALCHIFHRCDRVGIGECSLEARAVVVRNETAGL